MPLTEEELLRCPGCVQIYDDPICLPCGHSLCATCLESLVNQNFDDSSSDDETVSCLVCGSAFVSSAAHYPRNIALQKLCEYLTDFSTDSVASEPIEGQATTEVMFCEEHNKQVIERFCLICRTLICTTCEGSTKHNGHAVVSLSEGDNLTEVHSRVIQYCEERITATRERLELNRANLDNIRNCLDSIEKAFRLLEYTVAGVLRVVFLGREKFLQRGYRDEEIGCIEEGRILSTGLALTEMFLRNLTSVSKDDYVNLSVIHHALFHLNATPESVESVDTVSENAVDFYSAKLGRELNEVLDQCVERLIGMKSQQFQGAKAACRRKEFIAPSTETSSGSVKENADDVKSRPANGTQMQCSYASSSPVAHDRPCFVEFLDQFPRNETDINELNSAENNVNESSMENKVNLLTDEKTGKKYYVRLDEALDVKSETPDTSHSMKSVTNLTSESSDESLPEFTFL